MEISISSPTQLFSLKSDRRQLDKSFLGRLFAALVTLTVWYLAGSQLAEFMHFRDAMGQRKIDAIIDGSFGKVLTNEAELYKAPQLKVHSPQLAGQTTLRRTYPKSGYFFCKIFPPSELSGGHPTCFDWSLAETKVWMFWGILFSSQPLIRLEYTRLALPSNRRRDSCSIDNNVDYPLVNTSISWTLHIIVKTTMLI